MLKNILDFFSPHKREIKKAQKIVESINNLEGKVALLTDEKLAQSTKYFREKLEINLEDVINPDKIYSLDHDGSFANEKQAKELQKRMMEILPEVFARVREAAKRVANHRHFDVQLIAGIILAKNNVTEVFTGEGKTLIASLPAYLYGLSGRGVHCATVNDYLARRDGEWNGHIFEALGMTTGIITPAGAFKFVTDTQAIELKGEKVKEELKTKNIKNMSTLNGSNLVAIDKKEAYKCDVIYGQANEFGFDYLRDNMATNLNQRVQRYYFYSIVDEVDSILIDEARTPLIISTPSKESSNLYTKFADLVQKLEEKTHYTLDEKAHSVILTEDGMTKVEELLSGENVWEDYIKVHHLDNALKAKGLYLKDKHYIIQDDKILIVDQFTGRVLEGRRYSDGLHQAIEAKEKVTVQEESKTAATITFQNYFRQYNFLAGMTGTAITESEEFSKIYKLDVVPVPTYKKIVRKDFTDVVYKSEIGKFKAIVEEIKDKYAKGQPILVGTTSVEKSELLSSMLKELKIPHQVLNAKLHDQEAKIVAEAGKAGAVTIATNMAGRGTDIKLNKESYDNGGLYVIGTERHESRRIDNQLRGRSGRLGDPGASQFYISLEDDLMRIFGGDSMKSFISKAGLPEDLPIASSILSRLIESSQKKVESHNFDIRKRLVDYDDILNRQRDAIYDLRKRILILLKQETKDLKEAEIFDKLDIKDINGDSMLEFLNNYSLLSPYNNIEEFGSQLGIPLRVWILKQILMQLEYRLSMQLMDDLKTDKEELAHIWEYIDSLLPDDIQEQASKDIGFKNFKDFKKSVVDVHNPKNVKIAQGQLVKLLMQALILQYKHLGYAHIYQDYEKLIILEPLEDLWMDHLEVMGALKESIGLRGYAQEDPLVAYKNEGAKIFDKFFVELSDKIAQRAYRVQAVSQAQVEKIDQMAEEKIHSGSEIVSEAQKKIIQNLKARTIKAEPKVGRNDACPCGSGKKYKACHGKK